MHGVKRVLVFCVMIVILPATLIIIPLYLRKTVFADVTFPVAESDIIEIREGISSIFCEQHTLRMSSNFNAFQLRTKPEISTNRKHIRLKKSMTLPDDTLEYWGFYLLKGAKVHLKFCSRYDGSRILVVKGQRELHTCGLLEHNNKKLDANFAQGHEQVRVFFEDITEIVGNGAEVAVDAKTEANQKMFENLENVVVEAENHAGEDFADEFVAINSTAETTRTNTTTTTTTTPPPATLETTTMRRARKKLKKGRKNPIRNQETENTMQTQQPDQQHQQEQQQHRQSDSLETLATSSETSEAAHMSTSTEKLHSRSRRQHVLHKLETAAERTTAYQRLQLQSDNHAAARRRRRQIVYDELYKKRDKRDRIYDRKYSHGGNALNFTDTDESNSISSFENGLFDCFDGSILLAEGFPPSPDCYNAHFLENGSHRMLSKHDITEDGYYYYIFYSDNDLVRNDIHAIFDIYKPTFQYSNDPGAQGCLNSTNCTFNIGFLSDEIVVVEVPTRDGIEHEEDDITYLISTCHPRAGVYSIFPILVLVLILSCSFL